MSILQTIVNKNDNHQIRNSLYKGTEYDLLHFVPLACLLIQRYSKEAWKNDAASPEFCLLEYQLTTCLKTLEGYCLQHNKRPDFNVMSWCLKCPTMLLHNDVDLNRFING